jgi:hypothetical protein
MNNETESHLMTRSRGNHRRGVGVFEAVAGPAQTISGGVDVFRGTKTFLLTIFVALLAVLVWMAIL